jgi:hypothetical protein
VKIKPNLLGWRQIRQSIQEDNYGDKWVVLESRYRRYNSEWGKWELRSEAPVPPYTTNMDLEATMKILTGKEKDIVALDVVFIHVRDKLGRSYWWENKLYCNFLHEMYELE